MAVSFHLVSSRSLLTHSDRNWIQLGKQVAWAVVGITWTFVITYAIMFLINLVPGLHFRATEEAEIVGMDEVELGEYVADYAFFDRDLEGQYQHPGFKDHYKLSRAMTGSRRGRGERSASAGPTGPREAGAAAHMTRVHEEAVVPDAASSGSNEKM